MYQGYKYYWYLLLLLPLTKYVGRIIFSALISRFFMNDWDSLALTQCDRIERFFKFLMTNFLIKVAQVNGDFLAFFEKYLTLVKTTVTNFWGNFLKFWLLFISTSDHTAHKSMFLSFFLSLSHTSFLFIFNFILLISSNYENLFLDFYEILSQRKRCNK